MRKLISTLLLAGLVPACMFGVNIGNKVIDKSLKPVIKMPTIFANQAKINPIIVNKEVNTLNAGIYNGIFSWGAGGGYAFNSSSVDPFVYEPSSGNLMVSLPQWNFAGKTAEIGIFNSTDFGATWGNYTPIISTTEQIVFYPSMSVMNKVPSNKDVANLDFFFGSASNYPYPEANYSGKAAFYIKNSDGQSITNYSCPSSYATNYDWNAFNISTYHYEDEDIDLIFGASTIEPKSTAPASITNIAYAAISADAISNSLITNSTPTRWAVGASGYFKASTISENFSDVVRYDIDNSGVIYAAFQNYFIKIDADNRSVGFTKSTDYGETWTDYDMVPSSIFTEYGKSRLGVDDFGGYIPTFDYRDHSFKVYGNGNLSFVGSFLILDASRRPLRGDIVEISKVNGQWAIHQIYDYTVWEDVDGVSTPSCPNIMCIVNQQISKEDEKEYFCYVENPLNREVKVGITADGKYLVAKWIDYKRNFNASTQKYTLVDPIVASDSLLIKFQNNDGDWLEDYVGEYTATDIFVAVKDIEAGTWGEAKNVTNDNRVNHLTHMPSIIPNIENIPIFSLLTQTDYPATDTVKYEVPAELRELFTDAYSDAVCTVFNGNPQSVEEPTIEANDFSIYPNPVADNSYINLKVQNGNSVNIEVYNMLGEKVLNVFNGMPTSNTISFNTNELANGAYVCRVTNGSKVSSVVFTVSK